MKKSSNPIDPGPNLPAALAGLWQDYQARGGIYDETRDEQGNLRACWARYFQEMAGTDGPGLTRMQEKANRQLRAHGATFHLHSSGADNVHPWRLDPLPLLIEHQEWLTIDRGLQQRARLLSLVLSDLYGPQDLIRQGLIPQDLALRHPGFQPACWNSVPRGPLALFHYAADLARGPGGRMWVVKDHTGIPPGTAYMLENRTILDRLIPDPIRRLQVHRLSGSFRAMRAGLRAIAPNPGSRSRIVFLTPGPYSPAYFEHTFLASYLGYTLVQGDDLLVRNGKVWLKALEGLQPVDVIFRRVPDALCDPLELDEASLCGIPGLLEAVRRGSVAVANAVGSRVLENPGLMPFLPGLAQALLDEELILPTAATWWCGQAQARTHVLAHLENLVIKQIDQTPVTEAGGLGPYAPEQRAALVAAIEAEPWRYIGQERVGFSSMPVLENGRFEPRAMTLRAFVVHDGIKYHTMPGGLTRCGKAGQTYIPSNQLGGICKDTWVLAPEPVAFNSLWLERHAEGKDSLLAGFFTSRTVENLFWTGRYAERAGCLLQTLRVLLQTYDQSLESGTDAYDHCLQKVWQGLLTQAGLDTQAADKQAGHPAASLQNITKYATHLTTPGGLPMALNGFVNAAYTVRENWSTDTWSIINRLQERTSALPALKKAPLSEVQDALDGVLQLLQAFSGQCAESMTRTAGWLILEIGRRIEHATMVINLLAGALDQPCDELTEYYLLEGILTANESLITFRRAYRTTPALRDVLDLVLIRANNPKSLRFQLEELQERLERLAREIHQESVGDLVGTVNRAVCQLAEQNPAALALAGPGGRYENLARMLSTLRDGVLHSVAEDLSHICFKHAPLRYRPLTFAPHHLLDGRTEV